MDELEEKLTNMMIKFREKNGGSFKFKGDTELFNLEDLFEILQSGLKEESEIDTGVRVQMELIKLRVFKKFLVRVKEERFRPEDFSLNELDCLSSIDVDYRKFTAPDTSRASISTEKRSTEEDNLATSKRTKLEVQWQNATPTKDWPPEMPPKFELNKIYSIPHLDLACIVGYSATQRFFFRQQAFDLYQSLSSRRTHQPQKFYEVKCRGVMIEGAPGTGKSCTTWAWILSQLVNSTPEPEVPVISDTNATRTVPKTDSVLWIHLESCTATFVRLTRDKVERLELDLAIDSQLELAQFKISEATEDIVVLDGLLSSEDRHRRLCNPLEKSKSGYFHIQVASLAFISKGQRKEVLRARGVQTLVMYPWSIAEYQLACDDPDFFWSVSPFLTDQDKDTVAKYNKEDRDKLLSEKYYFAGVCVRWFFARTIATIIEDVQDRIDRISSLKSHWEKDFGESSNRIKNGLLVSFNNASGSLFFVSEFVAVSLADKCEPDHLQTLYSVAKSLGNPSFQGWVFEMEVILAFKNNEFVQLFNQDGQPDRVASHGIVKCLIQSAQDKSLLSEKNPSAIVDKFIVPRAWNNPGFDLSRLTKYQDEWHLVFYQITISPKHKYKLKHFVEHLTNMIDHFKISIDRASIVQIVPTERKTDSTDKVTLSVTQVAHDAVEFVDDMANFKVGETADRWPKKDTENQIKTVGFQPIDYYYNTRV